MDFQLCTQVGFKGKYNMLYGRDEQAVAALLLGAEAAVSSTIGYAPSLRNAVSLWRAGKQPEAVAQQKVNAELCSFFGAYESQAINVQKNIMAMVGMPVGPSRLACTSTRRLEWRHTHIRTHAQLGCPASLQPKRAAAHLGPLLGRAVLRLLLQRCRYPAQHARCSGQACRSATLPQPTPKSSSPSSARATSSTPRRKHNYKISRWLGVPWVLCREPGATKGIPNRKRDRGVTRTLAAVSALTF